MTAQEFKAWLEGYSASFLTADLDGHATYLTAPDVKQWQAIKGRIAQLDNAPMYHNYRPPMPYWYGAGQATSALGQYQGATQAVPGQGALNVTGQAQSFLDESKAGLEHSASLQAMRALGRAEAANPGIRWNPGTPNSLPDAGEGYSVLTGSKGSR